MAVLLLTVSFHICINESGILRKQTEGSLVLSKSSPLFFLQENCAGWIEFFLHFPGGYFLFL